ncbi:leucyl aminopeptidase family protein [Rhabdaerophilum sp. SD176]|uniref:leucyl aminopeptidase family protein n=1 Tax=Rhabdaerophilum sp. SD176 TaxID=2983548 RepID=UPI0024DFB80D|nr:leucyl aminopeptidase family protein [Rhabdaerophilum sp. SD176]
MPAKASKATPILLVAEEAWKEIAAGLSAPARRFAETHGFEGRSGKVLPVPDAEGRIEAVLFGTGKDSGLSENPFLAGKLPAELPGGRYRLEGVLARPDLVALAFRLGGYRFDRFKEIERPAASLELPKGVEAGMLDALADGVILGRDLINRPANDLGTGELAEAAKALAARHGAKLREITGDALLKKGFPLIHAVGRAAANPPRLVDIRWGDPADPAVTLVGKGVIFDTGGLNLKPDNSMLLMKKDMGGAATALAAASILMALKAKIRLRVLLPMVENAVAGNAFRPGDILRSRKGLTVEIGNTDAEGRLILADALALADEDKPDLLIDYATLTGAARVALGPDLPPFYTDDEALAGQIAAAGTRSSDPVWRLPLWKPYSSMIESKSADINNAGVGGFAGSVTAALFLKRFVTETKSYAHFDIYGWVPSAKPGRPEGGEPQAARLTADLVLSRFGRR